MASPTTELRQAVVAILEQEFAAEAFPVKPGRLHPAVGERGPIAGVAPESEGGHGALEARTRIVVQVYGRWTKKVDVNAVVDAAAIEEWAWRFRRALRDKRVTDGTHVWWFNLADIRYPDDPVGQKTRFEAVIEAVGPNAGVVETTA